MVSQKRKTRSTSERQRYIAVEAIVFISRKDIYIYAIELTSKGTIERILYLLVSRKLVGIVFKLRGRREMV